MAELGETCGTTASISHSDGYTGRVYLGARVHELSFLGGINRGDHYNIDVSLPGRQLRRSEEVNAPLRGTMAKLLPVLSSICMSVHFPVGSVAHSIKQSPPCLYESPGPAHQNQIRPGVSKSARSWSQLGEAHILTRDARFGVGHDQQSLQGNGDEEKLGEHCCMNVC